MPNRAVAIGMLLSLAVTGRCGKLAAELERERETSWRMVFR